MYQLVNIPEMNIQMIKKLDDNLYIPICDDNIHYKEYLEWVAEGNEPLPADE